MRVLPLGVVVLSAILLGCPAPPVPTHAIAVTVSGAGAGTVASSPSGISDCSKAGGTCSGQFAEGEPVTLTATPADGYFFAGWSGGCAGVATCSFSPSAAVTVRAVFVPVAFFSYLPVVGTGANPTRNVWTVRSDGTGLAPVTQAQNISHYYPTWSPDGERLLHTSNRDFDAPAADIGLGSNNAWVINPDGSEPVALTRLENAYVAWLAWVADGRVVFGSNAALDGSDASQEENLWIVNADGTGRTALTQQTDAGPDIYWWSADAQDAFYSARHGLTAATQQSFHPTANVFRVSLTGGAPVPLTQFTAANATKPKLSPDGTRVAFISNHVLDPSDDDYLPVENLWVVNRDGTNARPVTQLTTTISVGAPMGWTPDGAGFIVFSQRAPDGSNTNAPSWNIFRVSMATGEMTPLTAFLAPSSDWPQLSPDGRTIVFSSWRALGGGDANGPTKNLFSMNADGSGVLPLTQATEPAASSSTAVDVD